MRNLWEPNIQRGWRIGLLIAAALLITAGGLLFGVTQILISIWTFLMSLGVVLALLLLVWMGLHLWNVIHAAYEMDRNAITIHWGLSQHQIPMASVREVFSGEKVSDLLMRPGLRWPGYLVGAGEAEDLGPILFYATAPLEELVIIRTGSMSYAISPEDLEEFLTAFRERMEMGPTQEVEEASTHPGFLDWWLWQDQMAWGSLALSLASLVLLLGVICGVYPALPSEIAMRFGPGGETLLVTGEARIFYFGLMGGVFLLLNGGLGLALYRRVRVAAYFLWSGMLMLEGGVWAALLTVLLNQP